MQDKYLVADKVDRKNVEFSAEGVLLRGWFYQPSGSGSESGSGEKRPTIIMAHGFSAQKEHHLDQYAQLFAGRGKFNVLLYDHRHWGESDGLPRFEIDPEEQVRDFRHAITFAETLPEVDKGRIGLWGTSFSGGHVLVVAAIDRRVKAVVAQVPFVDGFENFRRRTRPEVIPFVEEKFHQDRRRRAAGEDPEMLAVVAESFKEKAVIPGPRAYRFFTSVAGYPNKVTLRSLEMSRDYVPLNFVSRISPTPLLVVASLGDVITPTDLQLAAFEGALAPKELITLKGDHFSAYQEEFDMAAHGALEFFLKHL